MPLDEMRQGFKALAPQTRRPPVHSVLPATTWPGAWLPHVWLHSDRHGKLSSLDLAGKGRFALFTGIGGEGWIEAAKRVGDEFGMTITTNVVGPRQEWRDLTGDWANAREVRDSGIVLTRPDQHVCSRRDTIADDPTAELFRVFRQILNRRGSSHGRA